MLLCEGAVPTTERQAGARVQQKVAVSPVPLFHANYD